MEITTCIDKNYLIPCGVMIFSICANNRETDITFHIIIDESITNETEKSFEEALLANGFKQKQYRLYRIKGEQIKKQVKNLPRLDETNPKKHITTAAYYRLFLSEILPTDIDKILYLDSDIIIRHSIAELWNTDLDEKSIAAVPDLAEGVIDKYNRLCYPMSKGYFNSGVLLINLKKWRDNHIFKAFTEFIRLYPDRIKLHDQDVLNRIFVDDKKTLPIKYNFQDGFLWKEMYYDYQKYEKEVLEARKDPIILHFTDSKPWIKECTHPWKKEYIKYLKQTIWANIPLQSSKKRGISTTLKDILRKLGILSPLPVYPNKYIEL